MTQVYSRHDEGAGSILVVIMMVLVVAVGTTVMVVLAAVARQERVQIAADTAATAAVSAALAGADDPCAQARRSVALQGLRQVQCTMDGAVIEVLVDEPEGSALFRRAATARAGPAPSSPW